MTVNSDITPWKPGQPPGIADRDMLEALRARFIANPAQTDLSAIRPVIARSWKRSALCNVSTAKKIMEVVAEPQIDEQFLRCAEPVIAELERLSVDAQGCVSLADPTGTISVFRGEPGMVRWAERTFPTIGGAMSEEIVGTNSDGTAIEEGTAVQVWGGEHYNEALQDSYCTSVPIIDPLRRSIRGVLSLTLPERLATDLDPRTVLMIVRAAGAEIARALRERLAPREQVLLTEYLREVRKRGSEAVVAMDEHTTIMNRGAMQLLDKNDHAVLAAYAREAGFRSRATEHEILCNAGRILHLQVRPVAEGDGVPGSVMRLRPIKSQPGLVAVPALPAPGPFDAMIGASPALRRALDAANAALQQSVPAFIFGEAGTGKARLGRLLAEQLSQGGRSLEIEWEDRSTIKTLARSLRRGEAVLLRRVERMGDEHCVDLMEALDGVDAHRLVLTGKCFADALLPLVTMLRAVEVRMPPLRMRREDVGPLVAYFLGKLDRPRVAAARLVEQLAAAEWPGNVAQLRETVESAAAQAIGREVRSDDLTLRHSRALAPSHLSRLQKAELQQIREALDEAGGNRLRAAEILRIGRSTLYRRIDYYTSRGFELSLAP